MKTPLPVLMSQDTPQDASFERGIIPAAERRCLNCQTLMQGPYCYQCGQHEKASIRHFGLLVRDIIDDVLNLDSRAARTVKPLLFSPGFLTTEYLAGRRMRYVPPLRLYVICSLLFFLLIGIMIPKEGLFEVDGNNTNGGREIAMAVMNLSKDKSAAAFINDPELLTLSVLAEQYDTLNEAQQKDFVQRSNQMIQRFGLTRLQTELGLNKKTEAPTTPPTQNENTTTPSVRHSSGLRFDDFGLHLGNITAESSPLLFEFQTKVNERFMAIKDQPGQMVRAALSVLPQSMFVLLPLFALLLKLSYPLSNRLYVEHLITAVHSHCFLFLQIVLLIFIDSLPDTLATLHLPTFVTEGLPGMIAVVGIFWIPIYLFMMQKRVYGQGLLLHWFKFILIGSLYVVLLTLMVAVAFVIGVINS